MSKRKPSLDETIGSLTAELHEAREALVRIRDVYVPALRRDASEQTRRFAMLKGLTGSCPASFPNIASRGLNEKETV